MLSYACDNCKNSGVPDGMPPCNNCIPHSEGWSGFQPKDPAAPKPEHKKSIEEQVIETNLLLVALIEKVDRILTKYEGGKKE